MKSNRMTGRPNCARSGWSRILPMVLGCCALGAVILVLVVHSRNAMVPASNLRKSPEPVVSTGSAGVPQCAVASSGTPKSRPAMGQDSSVVSGGEPGQSVPATDGATAAKTNAVMAFQQDMSSELPAEVAYFANVSIPLETREKQLLTMAGSKSSSDIRTLMEVASSGLYLSGAAAEALGGIDDTQVRALLRKIVAEAPTTGVRRLCASVTALAHLDGAAAVPDIARVLEANRSRKDGLNELVEQTCVRALGSLTSDTALPVLRDELDLFGKGSRQDLDYGLSVAQALWNSQPGGPDAVRALSEYAKGLEARMPACLEQVRQDLTAAGATQVQLERGEQMVIASYKANIKSIDDLLTKQQGDR